MPEATRLTTLNRPLCEGRVSNFTTKMCARKRGIDPGACQMRAVYRIGRKKLCDHHARQLALHLLLEGSDDDQNS